MSDESRGLSRASLSGKCTLLKMGKGLQTCPPLTWCLLRSCTLDLSWYTLRETAASDKFLLSKHGDCNSKTSILCLESQDLLGENAGLDFFLLLSQSGFPISKNSFLWMQIKNKYDSEDSLSPQAWTNAYAKHTLGIFPLKTWSLYLYFIVLPFCDVTNLMSYVSVSLLS